MAVKDPEGFLADKSTTVMREKPLGSGFGNQMYGNKPAQKQT